MCRTSEEWREAILACIDAGGPTIVFQPIVELWGGAVTGYEALSRFGAGENTEVWFRMAHKLDLAVPLEQLTARKALALLHNLPPHVDLSVNVCEEALIDPLQLGLGGMVEEEYFRVVLEICEHETVHDYERLRQVLAPLRQHGMRVAVDDLGAGAATFRHVLEIAPDSVKLDGSVVTGCGKREADDQRALLIAMTAFCARVGVKLVCEGIETEAEQVTLRSIGVKHGQGYYFGVPQPL